MIEWLTYFIITRKLCLTNKSKCSYTNGIKYYINHNNEIICSQDVSSLVIKGVTQSLFLISPKRLCPKTSIPWSCTLILVFCLEKGKQVLRYVHFSPFQRLVTETHLSFWHTRVCSHFQASWQNLWHRSICVWDLTPILNYIS